MAAYNLSAIWHQSRGNHYIYDNQSPVYLSMNVLSLILLSLCLLTCPTEHTDPLIENGLVAYYTFNNCDARDDSGRGSDGKLYGRVDCWCGIEDDGLLFDGRQGYIEFEGPVNRYFTTSDVTISFYVKPEGKTVFSQSLISKREECNEYFMLDIQLGSQQQWVLPHLYETPNRNFRGLEAPLDSTGWVHVAVVRHGFRAITYINGQAVAFSTRCSGVDLSNDARLSFGNSPCLGEAGLRRFRGVLDELRIYDRALTEEEVLRLYQLHPIEHARIDCVT